MDFSEAQQNYKDLSKSYFGGQLSMADFHREVRSLQVTDDGGRRWRINSHSGKWQAMQDGIWRDANPTDSPSPRDEKWAQVKLSTAISPHTHSETRFSLEVALAFGVVLSVIIGSVVIIVLELNPIR